MTRESLGPVARVLMIGGGLLFVAVAELLFLRLSTTDASLSGVFAAVAVPSAIGVALAYYGLRG